MDIPLTRCIGKFSISEDMVKHYTDAVLLVMAECVIVRCEMDYETMSFKYVAISRHFDDSRNLPAPEYRLIMERVNEGEDEGKILFKGFERA